MGHRVGVIGFFSSVKDALRLIPQGCELAALCDLKEDLMRCCRKEDPRIFCTTDYRELAKRRDVESVITYTPNETHRGHRRGHA